MSILTALGQKIDCSLALIGRALSGGWRAVTVPTHDANYGIAGAPRAGEIASEQSLADILTVIRGERAAGSMHADGRRGGLEAFSALLPIVEALALAAGLRVLVADPTGDQAAGQRADVIVYDERRVAASLARHGLVELPGGFLRRSLLEIFPLGSQARAAVDEMYGELSQQFVAAQAPIVMWSGGKDSQVLLWLVRQINRAVPVFFFREPFQAEKFDFANYLRAEWALRVETVQPFFVDVIGNAVCLELVNVLKVSEREVICLPTGVNQNEPPRAAWQCGVEVRNKPVTEALQWRWDTALIGHRADDVDPIQGPLPLVADEAILGPVKFVYPLRKWTEADIWEATKLYGIPQDYRRYDPFDNFKELADRRRNPDYMDICVECLRPGESATVHCPKLDGPIDRIGNQLDPAARAAAWRAKFVNLQPSDAAAR